MHRLHIPRFIRLERRTAVRNHRPQRRPASVRADRLDEFAAVAKGVPMVPRYLTLPAYRSVGDAVLDEQTGSASIGASQLLRAHARRDQIGSNFHCVAPPGSTVSTEVAWCAAKRKMVHGGGPADGAL
jgi:hypothetical protein